MQTLERHDIKKLEGYIKNIKHYRKELRFRGYELLENHDPENIGSSKSNIPGNPIERGTLKKFSDKKYNALDNIVSSVDKLLDNVSDETFEIMKLKYWNEDGEEYTWDDIADEFFISRRTLGRRRDKWLMMLADYMAYY
ncbi:transcriptional regulator [Staphylococcus gallinarum]|uniref:transcriptional regulator n=1 Tax=Staphylococcus gallinarum TaxID=1293 RepID=UPI001E324A13|nr:transcriptional regulator [Staphylococcus gallinarum]UEH02022.1 transcriptional regulator [Staphylococcus gallinarum]